MKVDEEYKKYCIKCIDEEKKELSFKQWLINHLEEKENNNEYI